MGRADQNAIPAISWEEPIPLSQVDVPEFPTDALPDWLRDFVTAEARATQTPPDLAAMLALSVCSFPASKKAVVRVRSGFDEPLNLFTVIALPPANRKSAVFRDVTAPIVEAEREAAEAVREEVARSQSAYRVVQDALKKAENKAARRRDDPAVQEEARQLASELSAMRVTAMPRFVVNDCSPERLATFLAEQRGRVAVFAPEGDVFDLMAGRYSATGSANFGVFLNGHAGDDIRVDRVGRASDYVAHPALTVGLAVQPDVIRGLMQKQGFHGRGLLARFLYAMPESLLGRREIHAEPVPDTVTASYCNHIRALLAIPDDTNKHGETVPHVIELEDEAREALEGFEAELEPQLGRFGDLAYMSDWAGKLVGAIVRIVGILRLGDETEISRFQTVWISREQMERAIRIGRYLIPHARAAYGEMGGDPVVGEAAYILDWVQEKGRTQISKRDLFHALRGRFKKVQAMEPALALLTEHSFIKAREVEAPRGAGRPSSPVLEFNPRVSTQNDHNDHNSLSVVDGGNSGNCAPSTNGHPAKKGVA